MNKVAKYFLFILINLLFVGSNVVFAEHLNLPETMVSLSQEDAAGNVLESGVVVSGIFNGTAKTIYGGTGGNQVVLNYNPEAVDVGFIKTDLDACSLNLKNNGILPNVATCFLIKDASKTSMKRLTSKTEYNNFGAILEVSTLIYAPNIIQGDVYGSFDPTNFAFYGRNLNQASGDDSPANGSWNVANYTLNPEAQSSFDKDQLAYMKNRVLKLAGEAERVPGNILKNFDHWYLQNEDINNSSVSEAAKYPEGKTWLVTGCEGSVLKSCLKVVGGKTYHGKGTLIFLDADGSFLEMGVGSKIIPAMAGDNSLGIILAGKDGSNVSDNEGALDFKGNNKLNAAVLTFGTIGKSGNGSVEAIGSFVANSFENFAGNGFSHFTYDYKLDQMWPPGFRYFNMPTSKNGSAN